MSRRINRAMTATLATLPLDIILSISALLSDPLDLLSLSQVRRTTQILASDTNPYVDAKTCHSAFLASQAWASYWSKLVPAVHLSRPAPWHSYSPSELRDAHIRYATTHRQWQSPSPTFKPPLRLPPLQDSNGYSDNSQRWRLIRGTRWAWYFWRLTGEIHFCDLRAGLVIGKWSAGGPVIDAFIESRSPNEWVLCQYWKTSHKEDILEYVLDPEGLDTTRFEIVATSVTIEQEKLTSPTKLSFRTIQRAPIDDRTSLSNGSFTTPMVLWRDYLIGSYVRPQPRTHGLFLWNMRENVIFYFEVCHSYFPSPGALNPNSRQMEFRPRCTKVIGDLLFTIPNMPDGTDWNTTYHCIHLPSLVTTTQVPGGFLSLTENTFAMLLPKSIIESRGRWSPFYAHSKIYSIPACTPTHPRYCFIIKRFAAPSWGVEWMVFEVEIDMRIPGPIKGFSKVSQQYTVQCPINPLYDVDDDLLLYLPLGREDISRASLCIQFLRVGKPGKKRLARLKGMVNLHSYGLSVDRDAGYVIFWATEDRPPYRSDHFIWWLDERKLGNMVYSQTRGLISGWSRGLLRRL